MKLNKTRFLFGVFVLILILCGGLVNNHAQAGDNFPAGPYTEIQLPLEDLPALNENLAYHPVIDQYPSGATLQVLYVLDDPRDVPLARYAYNKTDYGVIAPTNRPASWSGSPEYDTGLEELKTASPKTVNVYLWVQAPDDQQVADPVFAGQDPGHGDGYFDTTTYNGDRPALFITSWLMDWDDTFPCAVPEYASSTIPYQLPDEIEGGQAIGSGGLYDPKAYAPPRPWYYNENMMMEPGEVREGWISCLAPDLPLEDVQIQAWYNYIEAAQPTPTPGPSPTPPESSLTVINGDDCVIADSIDDPACEEASCCIVPMIPTLTAAEQALADSYTATEQAIVSSVSAEELYQPKEALGKLLAWSYTRVSTFPEGGIKRENSQLIFINEEGEQKTARGAVTFQSANVVQIERYSYNDFLFVSRVFVEPENLSEEDLQGFVLYRIDADIEIYEHAHATNRLLYIEGIRNNETSTYEKFMRANFQYPSWEGELVLAEGKQPFDNMFLHEPNSPFEGYVFADLKADSGAPISSYDHEWNGLLATALWFSIDSSTPDISYVGDPVMQGQPRYAARGVNIKNSSLVSSTNMCAVVDCLDVQDPDDNNGEVRTIPLLCPGEWANNFVIDGLSIEDIDYIGEPYGLKSWPDSLYRYSRFLDLKVHTWIYDGEILGGLSPWWSLRSSNNAGKVIDSYTGQYITGITYDPTFSILPYYYRDLDSYYLPTDDSAQLSGWIPEIINEKLLVFATIDDVTYTQENTSFLFMKEGPSWTNSCSRMLLPALSSSNSYAPRNTRDDSIIVGNQHAMATFMPGMDYPVSAQIISGEIFALGENGPPIYDQVLMPTEVKIVPGRATVPIVYVPNEDAFYPAEENISWYNSSFFQNAEAQLIPPDSSLVMVKIVKVPPGGPLSCDFTSSSVQLIYPHYYPIVSNPGSLRRLKPVGLPSCPEDFYEEWLFFKFPSLDIDPALLLFSIKGEENWNFWSLGEN